MGFLCDVTHYGLHSGRANSFPRSTFYIEIYQSIFNFRPFNLSLVSSFSFQNTIHTQFSAFRKSWLVWILLKLQSAGNTRIREVIMEPQLKTYSGNCHCSAFKFTVQIPELKKVTACNCSICLKKGYLWVFPSASPLTIERGDGSLNVYKFGTGVMEHKVSHLYLFLFLFLLLDMWSMKETA